MGLTYRDSGVDIGKGEAFVDVVKAKLSAQEQGNIGLFGGLYDLETFSYKHPVLVASTDGVGTKLLLARVAARYNTIGIDLVAMCVNDVVTTGATPLFFLDYFATCDLEVKTASQVLDGIITGCREAGCVLLGGETAEMPGVYSRGDYEIAGFTVGIVERERIIDGKTASDGDVLIGLGSSGIHSNGLSLARRAFFEIQKYDPRKVIPPLSRPLIDELLIPTKIYVSAVLDLLNHFQVKGIAHITGGGLYSNVKRILHDGLDIRIDWECIESQPIFNLIQHAGDVGIDEMRNTFNMGIGMVFIVGTEDADKVIAHLKRRGESAYVIGEVCT
jgi:phosphoribosylformylglycinamidine cyclo-ligase